MKKILLLVFVPFFCFSQVPHGFTYQAAAVNNDGNVISNQEITLRASIIEGEVNGNIVFQELHSLTTDNYGLFNIVVGHGDDLTSDLENVQWGNDLHFLKIELDISGGSNFVHVGNQQIMSVPYALYAESVNSSVLDSIYSVLDLIVPTFSGCMDSLSCNFNPDALFDDGSCDNIIYGCTDSEALNYNENASCDDGSCEYPAPTNYSGVINEDVTWTKDNIYYLSGRVVVPSGVTLTIEAGTVIKAYPGLEANASMLMVARGGTILAEGTATEPIIFTTTADQITNNHSNYPGFANLDESFKGLWGGLIVLGNAEISADAPEVQIEGIPASDSNGLYGGSDNADNSGVIRYVQIRHGGTLIGEGNEINGLTLAGVGSGTTVEYVEVIGISDDGIECFGGSVNISNALVWAHTDDGFDIDQSYSGTINNFMGFTDSDSDHAIEIDGPEGAMVASFTMTNGTLKGYSNSDGEYADFRKFPTGTLSNLYFHNFSCVSDFEIDGTGSSSTGLTFSSIEFNVSHLTDSIDGSACNLTLDDICDDQNGDLAGGFNASIVTTPTVGADTSYFSGWTCYFTEN